MGAMQIQRGFSSLFRLFEINSELMKTDAEEARGCVAAAFTDPEPGPDEADGPPCGLYNS
jgi:hypothetical protein